jgi:2-dehydro-3-deoxyphosphogluconate aldolase/(4S)-4-hydroxy-2-oxoglutarate aldolase
MTQPETSSPAASPGAARTQRQAATLELARSAGILAVLTVHDVPAALAVAGALARGGLTAVELALRSTQAMPALGALVRAGTGLTIGAGTVCNAQQAREAIERGAAFLVTPATPAPLAAALADLPIPAIPGAATPTEMLALIQAGFDVVKLFPAKACGGLEMVRSLAGPFPGLALCPTGGIAESDAADYLRQPNVACVGGSWMVRPEWIRGGEWHRIEEAARRARALLDELGSTRGRY